VYNNKFDFVPGEKVIFFEDFSDTDAGDYPARWTLGQAGGPVEVVEYQGKHWLKSIADGKKKDMRESHSFMRVDLSKFFPEKFTVEFDTPSTANMCIVFPEKYWATGVNGVCFGPGKVWDYWANVTNDSFSAPKKPLRHVSIAVSGTNVKTYFDGERVLLSPDGVRRKENQKIRTIGFAFAGGRQRQDLMFTNFKLAEGGKDYAKELVSGRIVTHGIIFDTGSDKLNPESGPTLRKILKLLQDDGDLRFEVQGHTDNQGNKKINQPLSEKRAEAVKTWLVTQGITADRLQTKGLGDTNPIDKNDTPEGRANNRRVEFVKI
jgi:outer membrane protein OmpA-like peptidoglycan-associated protein